MNRWKVGWGISLLLAAFVLIYHPTGSQLLSDTDTSVLLQTISKKHAPFSWFLSDWPLYNHFYRPIPTLLFELDQRLYGGNATGYGWTNAIVCAGCMIALFWFLREVTDNVLSATFGTFLFALWQLGIDFDQGGWLFWAAITVLVGGAVRHRRQWKIYVPAALSILFLERILAPLHPLRNRTLDWLPGRTATCMTLLALIAMASYSRYERLGPRTHSGTPSPLDPPATKSTRQESDQPPSRNQFAILAVLFTAFSLCSYEQAVMLPACLLGIAVYARFCGFRPTWALQVPFWGLLVAYIGLRHVVIPPGTSTYQAQQMRGTMGSAMMSLIDVAYPIVNEVPGAISRVQDEGFYILFSGAIYGQIFSWIVVLAGTYQLRRNWQVALTGWILAVLTFLPMAFLKVFEHYYYWPTALWTLVGVAAAGVAIKLAAIALSPPERQAPPRSHPAPGSLLGR